MTEFRVSSQDDTRLTFQQLAEHVGMSEQEFWQNVQIQLLTNPISELSKFLVEHGDRLETQGSEYFDPSLRKAAIMLQTLEGRLLALSSQGIEGVDDLRAQLQFMTEERDRLEKLADQRLETIREFKQSIDSMEARLNALQDKDSHVETEVPAPVFKGSGVEYIIEALQREVDESNKRVHKLESMLCQLPAHILVDLLCKKNP